MPWEACPFLTGDRGVDGDGVNGRLEGGTGGKEEKKTVIGM